MKAIGYYEKSGVIDVHTVRENINGVSELTGLEVLSRDEFEVNTKEISNQNYAVETAE